MRKGLIGVIAVAGVAVMVPATASASVHQSTKPTCAKGSTVFHKAVVKKNGHGVRKGGKLVYRFGCKPVHRHTVVGPPSISPVQGPVGPAGPQGPAGAPGAPSTVPGPAGPAGAKGVNGSNGATGATGPAGVQGPAGVAGPTGPQGDTGSQGTPGTPAPTSLPHWGLIARNTEGNGSAVLQPHGLDLSTGSPTDKVAFGNEVDFASHALPDSVSLSVFITGEDLGIYALNAPNVTMEIDTNGGALTAGDYSSLNEVLPGTATLTANALNTIAPDSFYLTGAAGTASGCNQVTYCTMAQVKAFYPNATILSVGINKGKDYAFKGYATSLSIGSSTVFFHDSVVSATA